MASAMKYCKLCSKNISLSNFKRHRNTIQHKINCGNVIITKMFCHKCNMRFNEIPSLERHEKVRFYWVFFYITLITEIC